MEKMETKILTCVNENVKDVARRWKILDESCNEKKWWR